MGAENLDTFNDMTPKGPEDVNPDVTGGEGLDTFDDLTPITDEPEKGEDESGKEQEQDKESNKEKAEEEDKSSQVDQLDEEEDGKEEEKEGDEKDDDKKSEQEGSEKDDDSNDDNNDKEAKVEGKEFVAKLGEEKFKVNENMTFKQKVDGKTQEVTLRELLNDYSGRVSWDKKFGEINEEKKIVQAERDSFKREYNEVSSHLKQIAKLMDDPEQDPMEALYYLLDISGRDRYDFYKKSIDTRLEEFERLSEMDETERKLYFREKELDLIRKRDESSKEILQKRETEMGLVKKVDEMREAHGVSEEQFEEAFDDLKKLYEEDKITAEQVISWAAFKPFESKATELLTPYKENLDDETFDDYVAEIAITMRDNPKISPDDIKKIVEEELGIDDNIKALTKKVLPKDSDADSDSNYRYGKKPKEDHVESFDDFDV